VAPAPTAHGLPAPEIDPTLIYECAHLIAVRHVPGASVQVLTNDDHPVNRLTSIGWSMVRPGKTPFEVGDRFVATQSMCDDRSPPAVPEIATNAPARVNAPAFDPPPV